MNKEAIAMAADSTVTFSGGSFGAKTYPSANKIFSLSHQEPVGVMVYGSAEFMGLPWEMLIKKYRMELGNRKFRNVDGYAVNLVKFLGSKRAMFPKDAQDQYAFMTIHSYFEHIMGSALDALRNQVEGETAKPEDDDESSLSTFADLDERFLKTLRSIIKMHHSEWKKAKLFPRTSTALRLKLAKKHKKFTDTARKCVFQSVKLTAVDTRRLNEIASYLFVKRAYINPMSSGIVVAGFGSDSIFPAFEHYYVEGIADGYMKARKEKGGETSRKQAGLIQQFAQSENVLAFINGVHPEYDSLVKDSMKRVVDELCETVIDEVQQSDSKKEQLRRRVDKAQKEIVAEVTSYWTVFKSAKFRDPMITAVSGLPKDELARLAEALVSITSLRQRYSASEIETVGGPIDVAIITKGDGFIWIKRKHYFEPERNPQYFARCKRIADIADIKSRRK